MAFVHISTTNSKLGAAIPSINLPAITTCRPDAPCFKECYARRGNFLYKTVQNSLANNLLAYKENPKLFFSMIAEQTGEYRRCRWHSSGDIVDENYLKGMCWVARKNPHTMYLCFTKKYELINAYIEAKHLIPRNLTIVFSAWKDFMPTNPHNFPTTFVFFPKQPEMNKCIPEDAIPCGGKCSSCSACWQLKKGQSVYFKKH